MIAGIIATAIVAGIYLMFKSSSDKSKENQEIQYRESLPIELQNQLNINDKQAFMNRIDYWIEEKNFKEALHLCNIFLQHNGEDVDIAKRKANIKILE